MNRPTFHYPRMGLAILAAIASIAVSTPLRADDRTKPANQYALLVGCTEYPETVRIPELYGPANDVPAWKKLLTDSDGFAFPVENITQLLGWPDDASKRPTRDNIIRGFAGLETKAKPGDRVFILLSGHGTQLPIPVGQAPLDPNDVEPDGLDEVFLPADTKNGPNGPENVIRDNEIRAWLDKIRARGADVLIVFDCCHAGTMTRSVADVERSRIVRPQDLGIRDDDIATAMARAQKAVQQAKAQGRDPEAEVQRVRPVKNPKGEGSLVAIYAAQPFETAPELPMPEGSPRKKENYYGFLSWTLIRSLELRQNPITYRELTQVMIAQYQAARGTRGPIPFAEGDLDREVLGFEQWPTRSRITLQNVKNQPLRVSAGQLAGVTPESVLAVFPPALDPQKRNPKTVLGHVRVKAATAYNAEVEPCDSEGRPSVAKQNFDHLSRCEVVARDYGDMRVRLYLADGPVTRPAFEKLDKEVREMMLLVDSEGEADWILRVAGPKDAAEYGLKLSTDHVLLMRGDGLRAATTLEQKATVEEAKARAEYLARLGKPVSRRVFGAYPTGEGKVLIGALERDLPKVFKWQNVLKVSGGVASEKSGDALGLKVEVVRLKEKTDQTGEVLRFGSMVPKQSILEFRVDNGKGRDDLWVVAIWLDAQFQIQVYEVIQVAAYSSAKFSPASIDLPAGVYGTESLVVFALPQSIHRDKPDFEFLNQSALRVDEELSRTAREKSVGESPFAQLIGRSTLSGGNTRSGAKIVNTTPAVIVQSWFVAP